MKPIRPAVRVVEHCDHCATELVQWRYPGAPRPPLYCGACADAGRRGAAGLCLLCPQPLPAHGAGLEICAPCWDGLSPHARDTYEAQGRVALLALLRGRADAEVRRSRYHR